MKIIVGTKNPAKLKAVEDAFNNSKAFHEKDFEIIGISVDSDVSEQPISIDETLFGAKNRAKKCKKEIPEGDYFIGLEGGVGMILGKGYIFGAVSIIKGEKQADSFSPFMELPDIFVKGIYEDGEVLGKLAEDFSKIKDVSKKEGIFGILSKGELNRSNSFEIALKLAIASLENK